MPSLYEELAPWWPLISAPEDYAEEYHGGHDGAGRSARYLEWTWDADPSDSSYLADYLFMLRDADGTVRAEHDRHVEGLFPRATWLRLLADAGVDAVAMPLEHSEVEPGVTEVFVGRKMQ